MCRRVKFVSISGVIAAVVESMTSSVTCLCALAVFDLANIARVLFLISYPILFVASLPITLSCFCCPLLLYFLLFQFLLALFISLSLFLSFPFLYFSISLAWSLSGWGAYGTEKRHVDKRQKNAEISCLLTPSRVDRDLRKMMGQQFLTWNAARIPLNLIDTGRSKLFICARAKAFELSIYPN